jgi:diguanylate cyclase (GGDEF)-like protein
VSLGAVLDRNDAAGAGVRRRDAALLAASALAAVLAVSFDAASGPVRFVVDPIPRLTAAAFSLTAGVAVFLAVLDRSRRETARRGPFRILALAGLVLWGGQAIGYVATAGAPGNYDLLVEVIPLAVFVSLAAYALIRICWPATITVADARVLVLDSLVTVLALLVLWLLVVLPAWVDVPDYDRWEHFDQALMFVALALAFVLAVLARRIGSLPFVQISLLCGGIVVYFLSGLLGQLVHGLDDVTGITYSIVGYVVAAVLVVAFAHRPAVEREGPRARLGRELLSTSTPLVLTFLASAQVVRVAGSGEVLGLPATVAAGALLTLWLLTVLVMRMSATRELARIREGTLTTLVTQRTREGWFRALVGDSRDFIFVLDPLGVVVYASPRVEAEIALHDVPAEFDPEHRHLISEVLVDSTPAEVRLLLAQVSLDPAMVGPHELQMRAHGGIRDVSATVRPITDIEFQGYVFTAHDVTAARTLQRQLDSRSSRDTLTDLLNREGFLTAVRAELQHPDPVHVPVILVLDIERFGALNDGLGHDTGDDILREVARSFDRLPSTVCDAARLGSDTFALLLSDEAPEAAVGDVVEQVRTELRGLLLPDGREIETAFRAGYVVVGDASTDDADWLLEAADLALSRARSSRHVRLVEYHDDMRVETERRLRVEGDIRSALAEGRVDVFYQPIIRLADGWAKGSEALVRLRRPDGTLVPPLDFIPLAEDIGLIAEIGLVVLRRACDDTVAASLAIGRPLSVSVNLAVDQLQPDLVGIVQGALDDSGLPPEQLCLEVTESTLADLSEGTRAVLTDLRGLGVTVALDDFGTGYSSMSYLATLPVDVLKIDRSFVSVLGSSVHGFTLARLVVQLAEPLGLSTVAEGIETIEQADLLRGMGCEFGQGYLFARPMPYDDYVAAMLGPLETAALL